MKFGNSIFKTFFLSLCIIANTSFAYAQTASILPPAKTTFNDQNGKPLTSGTVDFYIPGTTTRKTTWQDGAETVPNTNPVVLDAAGRALIWGSGAYRQIVKDQNGNLIWDQITTDAAGSGTGGNVGDGMLVGTILPWSGLNAPPQYQFAYGQAISRTTYAALLAAVTQVANVSCVGGNATLINLPDTSNLAVGARVEGSCIPSASAFIISKTSSTITLNIAANISTTTNVTIFPYGNGNGSTTFNVPDLRGVNLTGRNNMGGVPSANLTSTYFASNPTNPQNSPDGVYARGGNQYSQLLVANLPPYTPVGQVTPITSTVSDIVRNPAGVGVFQNGAGTSFSALLGGGASISAISSTATFVGTAQGGTSTPLSIIPPTVTINYVIKVTPDTNGSSVSGVASIGGMVGVINCGTGLNCSSNTVSITVPTQTTINGVAGAFTCGTGLTCSGLGLSATAATGKPLYRFVVPSAFTAKAFPNRSDIVPSTTTGSSGVGSVTMTRTPSDVWRQIVVLNNLQSGAFAYVDPVNGNDANGPTCLQATPCKTLQYCITNCTALNIIGTATGIFDPFSFNQGTAVNPFHRLAFSGPAIIQYAGATYPLLNAQSYTLQSGSLGASTATYNVTLSALTGSSAPQRVLWTDIFDAGTGNNTRWQNYSNCAALTTAANGSPGTIVGWAYEPGTKKLCVSFSGLDMNTYKAHATALYVGPSGDATVSLIGGATLFIDSAYSITLNGVSLQAYNTGGSVPTFLVEGRELVKIVGASGNGIHTEGGFHYFDGVDCEYPQFDCFNHDPSSTATESMVVLHNVRAWYAGDIPTFGLTNPNRNGISCHGGTNCIGAAISMGYNYGPNVADTSSIGVTSLSWYTGLETTQSTDSASPGIGFYGTAGQPTAIRNAWVDTNSTIEETISLYAEQTGGVVKTTNGFYNVAPTAASGGTITSYTRNSP